MTSASESPGRTKLAALNLPWAGGSVVVLLVVVVVTTVVAGPFFMGFKILIRYYADIHKIKN